MQDLSKVMCDYFRMNCFTITNSTKKNLRRNIESTFGDQITFLNVSNILFLFPRLITTEKIFQELHTSQEDSQVVMNATNIIRKEITSLKHKIPWQPQPVDLEPGKFVIPNHLEKFLLYLFDNKTAEEASNQNSRFQHSMAQDLIYTITVKVRSSKIVK